MATITLSLPKEYEEAKKFFNQAIELTPDGMDYPDPIRNLVEFKK